jgi:hypothetical protein
MGWVRADHRDLEWRSCRQLVAADDPDGDENHSGDGEDERTGGETAPAPLERLECRACCLCDLRRPLGEVVEPGERQAVQVALLTRRSLSELDGGAEEQRRDFAGITPKVAFSHQRSRSSRAG